MPLGAKVYLSISQDLQKQCSSLCSRIFRQVKGFALTNASFAGSKLISDKILPNESQISPFSYFHFFGLALSNEIGSCANNADTTKQLLVINVQMVEESVQVTFSQ